jgi:glycosyltransferase involved in cell wall biosynthesis
MTPLVSVVMPVRNGARWLDEAIESVTQQTLPDLELLVIDDGSTDKTPQILSDWSSRDARIRLFSQCTHGLVAALNYGLTQARGSFFARLDADDRAMPRRLERQVQILSNNPAIGLLGSWAKQINENGQTKRDLKPETCPRKLADILERANPFIHSTVMLRADLARQLGGYRAAFEAAEDYDLWLRMSEVTLVANVAEPLIYYRRHSANVTARQATRQSFSARLAQRAARIRRLTSRDPASKLATAPDWRQPEALGSFYAEDAVVHRLLELADPEVAVHNRNTDFAPLLEHLSKLNHAERQLTARAMINLVRLPPMSVRFRHLQIFARMLWRRPGMVLMTARSLGSR